MLVQAQVPLPSDRWEPLNELILSEALTKRCQFLYFKTGPQCGWAATALVAAMDQKRSSKSGEFVVFYSDFVQIARSKWVRSYLEFVETQAMNALSEGGSFSLFDLSLEWVKRVRRERRDPAHEAARLIAVLFQDNISRLHLKYFENIEKEVIASDVLESLYRIHNNLLPSRFFQPDEKTVAGYFPPEVRNLSVNFNPGIYYFYMPWMFMEKVRAAFWNQSWWIDGLERDLPLLLSTLYKYKYVYGSYAEALLMPLTPTKLNSEWMWRYRDLYAAYVSTHLWRSKPRSVFSFQAFAKGMSEKPGPTLIGIRLVQ